LIPFFSIACSPQSTGTTDANSTGNSPANKRPLTVAVQPWIGFQGHFIATGKDLFAQEGIEVKEATFQAATDTNTALTAGKIDLAWVGGPDLITMVARAPSLKIIMVSDYSDGGDGILGRNITRPEDLKGKKVAREDAPYAIAFLGAYLAKGGMTEKDVEVLSLPANEAMTAFVSNQVDAATTYEPWLSQAVKTANAQVIFTSKDTNIIPNVLAATSETIANRRDDILAYLRAIDKGLALVKSDPSGTAAISAAKLGVKPEDIPAQQAGIKGFDVADNKSVTFNSSNPLSIVTSLESIAKTLVDLGRISQPVDANTLIDPSLINAL
jgi:NitT/TauT family transport system substrate-binding protein